ncbi:MAG: type VI secretion system tube protein TssD [Verrucomicrobiota bacterium]
MKHILLLMIFLTAACFAAEPIQVTIDVPGIGLIPGDGPKETIAGLAYQHEIVSPRDPVSGQATGRRQHKPFTIVKAIDPATPQLYQCLADNRSGMTVTLKFFKPATQGGAGEEYYTIVLQGAAVASLRNWKPNTRDLSADRAGDLEEVSFVYTSITWTYTKGGITATDTWSTVNP